MSRSPAQQSLDNRISLALDALSRVRETLLDVTDERELSHRQRHWVERQLGHLEGLREGLDTIRRTSTNPPNGGSE